MKIKFNRVRLVAALKKSKVDALEIHRKETKTYHDRLEKARDRHISNVEKYLAECRNDGRGEIEQYRLGDRLNKGCNFPSKPSKPRMEHVEALIQQLELSDDELVICDTKEEYVQLTRSCAILGSCKA